MDVFYMKFFFIPIVLLLIMTGCKKDENVKDLDITVLSYIVAGLPEGLSSSRPATNTPQISKNLFPYDIIHVQEDFCYHAQLYKYDNHPHRTLTSGCVPGGDGLNTLSNYAILNFKRIHWSDCNGTDCLTPKGFSYSQLIVNGQLIDCYNVHANAGTDPGDLRARQHNIAQLVAFIKENSEGAPCMVFGDFNCRYTRADDDIRLLQEEGFSDAWIALIRDGIVPEKGAPSLLNCEEKNNPECEVVDKVFFRGNDVVSFTPTAYQLDTDSFYDKNGNPLSDHYPLKVDFHLHFK